MKMTLMKIFAMNVSDIFALILTETDHPGRRLFIPQPLPMSFIIMLMISNYVNKVSVSALLFIIIFILLVIIILTSCSSKYFSQFVPFVPYC